MINTIKNIVYIKPINWILAHILRSIKGYRLPINFTITYDNNLKLLSNPTSVVCKKIFYERDFEYTPIIRKLFKVSEISTFFDVGANIGYYSIMAAKYGVRTYAFEPNDEIRLWLQDCIWENNSNLRNHISVLKTAMSNASNQKMVFYEKKNKRFPNIPSLSGISGFYCYKGKEKAVMTDTLDEFCKRRACAPGLIKIDVEGADPLVLQGAEKLMEKERPIFIVEYKRNEVAILQAFKGKKYVPYGHVNGKLVKYKSGNSTPFVEDMFFFPKEKVYLVNSLNKV